MSKHENIIENIFPEYQAIVDVFNSDIENNRIKIEKYEALLRSKDNNNQILYPNQILNNPDLNKTNITKQMFKKVIQDIKQYEIHVSFNINASDINNLQLKEYILKEINKLTNRSKKKIAEYITFEFVEEEEILNHKKVVMEFIKEIHNLKGKIALDDFGKGYSTIGPLIEFNFDIIKFDKILVENFLQNPIKYYLLDTLINMFNKLNKKIVVEYIENKKEFNAIKFIRCHYAQGFYIAKPQKIENYLKNKIYNQCQNEK